VVASSLKRALDLDWDDPWAREQALSTILQGLNQVENWIESQSELTQKTSQSAQKSLQDAKQIEEQDIESRVDGSPKLRQGVAAAGLPLKTPRWGTDEKAVQNDLTDTNATSLKT
jgi:hypothetical protein